MTLLVRNEEDILEQNIRFHLSQGVDFIVATDNASVDRTPEILERYQRLGVLVYRVEPAHTKEQNKWVSRMAKEAVEIYGATHLFHNDADEFWYARTGSLKHVLPNKDQIFLVSRYNFLPSLTASEQHFQNFNYLVKKPINLYELPAAEAIAKVPYGRIGPKVMTTNDFVELPMGNHDIVGKPQVRRHPTNAVKIYHFPIRSYKQFERKVIEAGTAYSSGPHARNRNGWHWKGWYKMYQAGELEKYYQRLFSPDSLEQLIAQGILRKTQVPIRIRHEEKLYRFSQTPFGSSLYSFLIK